MLHRESSVWCLNQKPLYIYLQSYPGETIIAKFDPVPLDHLTYLIIIHLHYAMYCMLQLKWLPRIQMDDIMVNLLYGPKISLMILNRLKDKFSGSRPSLLLPNYPGRWRPAWLTARFYTNQLFQELEGLTNHRILLSLYSRYPWFYIYHSHDLRIEILARLMKQCNWLQYYCWK